MERPAPFFHGSELSRLLILATLMVVGWALFWKFSQKLPEAAEAPLTVVDNPEPVIPDKSEEFETVTDKTPISFRDNAAYALLLERASREDPGTARLGQPPRHRSGTLVAGSQPLSRGSDPLTGDSSSRVTESSQAEQDRLAVRGLDHRARCHQSPLRLRI